MNSNDSCHSGDEIRSVKQKTLESNSNLTDKKESRDEFCCKPNLKSSEKLTDTDQICFPNSLRKCFRKSTRNIEINDVPHYTFYDWNQCNIKLRDDTNCNVKYSSNLRHDINETIYGSKIKVEQNQKENTKHLREQIDKVNYWRNQLSIEVEHLISANSVFGELKICIKKQRENLTVPLHVAEECYHHRKHRRGIELVRDCVDDALEHEIKCVDSMKNTYSDLLKEIDDQERKNCQLIAEIQHNIDDKKITMSIDQKCYELSNASQDIQNHSGIENYDPSTTSLETWIDANSSLVLKSKKERDNIKKISSNIRKILEKFGDEIWNNWNATNNEFNKRIDDLLHAKCLLHEQLQKLNTEINNIENNLIDINNSIAEKENFLKVAQSRLEARTHRPCPELCKDTPHISLVLEVKNIESLILTLKLRLEQEEEQKAQLVDLRNNLEHNLSNKINAVFIDQEKCMGIRRSIPITSVCKC